MNNQCPIAYWKKQSPKHFAFSGITFQEFDALIQRICGSIAFIEKKIIAFIPQNTPLDIAFFFAAWRMKKTIYPLSFRLPKEAIYQRIQLTNAHFIHLQELIPRLEIAANLDKLAIPDQSLQLKEIDEENVGTFLETSSSKKIVIHSLRSHVISAHEAIKALCLEKTDRYCLNLPLFHVSGIALFLRCFIRGATLLFPEEIQTATHISMVPTQLYRLLQERKKLPFCKCLLVGGAPLSKKLYQRALAQRIPVYLSYGMTETASMTVVKRPFCKTQILPHIQLKLTEEGEILMKGPSLFQGYFGTEKRSYQEWFASKDLGRFNQNNELEIIGRKDRQFISGGENIQPEEIEKALLELPEILEAHIESFFDEEFGQRPLAKIYCNASISVEKIQEKLKKILPSFKIPQKILFLDHPLKSSKMLQLSQNEIW